MDKLNNISNLEQKLSEKMTKLGNCYNDLNENPLEQILIKMLSSSFKVLNLEHLNDQLNLVRMTLEQADPNLETIIFKHPTIIKILEKIDIISTMKIVTDSNNTKLENYLEINHVFSELVLTIISLVNQEKI